MSTLFGDPAVAIGYATARPPVHPEVMALLRTWRGGARAETAADIGCGAGLSTRALIDVAGRCVGLDPSSSMIRVARRLSPDAPFIVASAEAIPLGARTIELLTAAGSLNFVRDLDAAWNEARRVLTRRGVLAVYDFSTGRSFADGPGLDEWFEAFVARYPWPRNRARPISPHILSELASGFAIDRAETFEVRLPMTCEAYVAYMLTETNVQEAVAAGATVESVRSWCTAALSPVFAGRVHEVIFRGYLACLSPL
jgi:SAM-dependent methyltransferase